MENGAKPSLQPGQMDSLEEEISRKCLFLICAQLVNRHDMDG